MASRKVTRVAALASRYSLRGTRAHSSAAQVDENDPTESETTTKTETSPPKGRGRKRKSDEVKSEPEIEASTSTNAVQRITGKALTVRPPKGRGGKRKSVEVKLEPEQEIEVPTSTNTAVKQSPGKIGSIKVKKESDPEDGSTGDSWFPPNWEEALNNIRIMRKETKDQVTYAAMGRLKEHGLTPENMVKTDTDVLAGILRPVGFYKRKAEYIKKASQILLDDYNGDIPDTLEKLCELPGVGPKMAHICMNSAWNVVTGIGVDTHVHRITKRIGWLPDDLMKMEENKRTPEHTRKGLESWLPKPLWSEVNHLLVGFGQTICKPTHPDCNACYNNPFCPSAKLKIKW